MSNHASTLDDPAVVAVLLPWDVVLRPRLMRWSVCSQEICFETPAISSFFGAGKVCVLYVLAARATCSSFSPAVRARCLSRVICGPAGGRTTFFVSVTGRLHVFRDFLGFLFYGDKPPERGTGSRPTPTFM